MFGSVNDIVKKFGKGAIAMTQLRRFWYALRLWSPLACLRARLDPRWAWEHEIPVDLVTAWEVAGTVVEAQTIAP